MLTAERLREVLCYDPEVGVFTWIADHQRRRAGDVAGSRQSNGYRGIMVDGVRYGAHRLAWLYVTGRWPVVEIDHEDTNRGNNAWLNLREATHAQNHQNKRKAHAGSQSGLLGVGWRKDTNQWYAAIQINGVRRYLGLFTDKHEAHAVYLKAKRELHPFNTL